MADNQDATIGWGAQVWIENATGVMTKLWHVTGLDLGKPEVSDVDVTHFESPDRSEETIPGLKKSRTITAEVNWRPRSDSDLLVAEAEAAYERRQVRLVIPSQGQPVENWTFTAYVSFAADKMSPKDSLKGTVTFSGISGIVKAAGAGGI